MARRLEQVGIIQYVKAGLLFAICVALLVAVSDAFGLIVGVVSVAVFAAAIGLFNMFAVADRPLPGRVTSRSDWLQIFAGLLIFGLLASLIVE